jgi:hypothetical protein
MRVTNKITPEPDVQWITVQKCSARYGLSSRSLYRLIEEGHLKSSMVKGRRLLNVSSLEAIIAAGM